MQVRKTKKTFFPLYRISSALNRWLATVAIKAKSLVETDHFNQSVEMVQLGSGSFRKVENYHLSHEACLAIAENADHKKPQAQMALRYFEHFAVQDGSRGVPHRGNFQ